MEIAAMQFARLFAAAFNHQVSRASRDFSAYAIDLISKEADVASVAWIDADEPQARFWMFADGSVYSIDDREAFTADEFAQAYECNAELIGWMNRNEAITGKRYRFRTVFQVLDIPEEEEEEISIEI